MKNYIFILLAVLIYSCKKEKEIKIFYDDGQIHKKYQYYNKLDTSSYKYYEYYQHGNLKKFYKKRDGEYDGKMKEFYPNKVLKYIIPFSNGAVNGTVKAFDRDGKIEVVKTYLNNKLNGIYEEFDYSKSKIVNKILYINDDPILKIEGGIKESLSDSIYGITYYYKNGEYIYPVGTLEYYIRDTLIRKQKTCTYFETFANDSISMNDTLKVKVVFHFGLHEDHNIQLKLGDLDQNYKFTDSTDVKEFTSSNNTIEFYISKEGYKIGNNLILGKIRLFIDDKDITNENLIGPIDDESYIFYHQYYVKDE